MEREYTAGRRFLIRLPHGGDLLGELTRVVTEKEILAGSVSVIGAVSSAALGYYDQIRREYVSTTFDRRLEILHCVGNISVKEGAPIIHAHLTLGDSDGAALGGHLVEGNTLFAGEATVVEFVGETLQRGFDEETGLPLWGGTLA